MTTTPASSSRRHALFTAGAAAAALLPMHEDAFAQPMRAGGDWLAMVKAQHKLIAATFDKLLASGGSTYLQQRRLQDLLSYQLTAHSVAEENVLYPKIAEKGLVPESDKLYLDQAHAKVMNAQLEMMLLHKQGDPGWLDAARRLQTAVLTHAQQDEEGQVYPKLQSMLSAQENAELGMLFQREFATVRPRRAKAA